MLLCCCAALLCCSAVLLQIKASRDSSGKGSGMVASRKKKLARHGAEKDENGHKFKVQVGYAIPCYAMSNYEMSCCVIPCCAALFSKDKMLNTSCPDNVIIVVYRYKLCDL